MRSARSSFAFASLVVLSASTIAVAQNHVLWQGFVTPDRIAVYETNSTSGNIVNTLSHGDVVDVLSQVRASGADWCRVARTAAMEPIGFVLCFNLQKENFESKQGAQNMSAGVASPTAATGGAIQPNSGSPPLTNTDVVDLHKAGLPTQVLIAKIKSSQCSFDTSPPQLSQLKSAGLPDGVILAMVEAPATKATVQASQSAPLVAATREQTPPPPAERVSAVTTTAQTKEQKKAVALCAKHPGWMMSDCEGIVAKRIWVGMTSDMLIASKGKFETQQAMRNGVRRESAEGVEYVLVYGGGCSTFYRTTVTVCAPATYVNVVNDVVESITRE